MWVAYATAGYIRCELPFMNSLAEMHDVGSFWLYLRQLLNVFPAPSHNTSLSVV